MFPTLWTGDICIMYKTKNLQRGDIITAIVNDKLIIKRVIGLPNETLFLGSNSINIVQNNNCTPLLENYILKHKNDYIGYITLGDNEVWIMGDNRPTSYDSRSFGPINKNQIIGKMLLKLCSIPCN